MEVVLLGKEELDDAVIHLVNQLEFELIFLDELDDVEHFCCQDFLPGVDPLAAGVVERFEIALKGNNEFPQLFLLLRTDGAICSPGLSLFLKQLDLLIEKSFIASTQVIIIILEAFLGPIKGIKGLPEAL